VLAVVLNVMAKVIPFPVVDSTKLSEVVLLRNYLKSNVIDLAEQQRKLREIKAELRRLKARMLLKVVHNGNDKGDDS
jgi:hypothetical protein